MHHRQSRGCFRCGPFAFAACVVLANTAQPVCAAPIDLSNAAVVVREGALPPGEEMASVVLIEEMEKRAGIRLERSAAWPESGPVIAIASHEPGGHWPIGILEEVLDDLAVDEPEGFVIRTQNAPNGSGHVIWIMGTDGRGALYGVGALLRKLHWRSGAVWLPEALDMQTAPRYPLRGHQLGYRARGNTYAAWSRDQYEQYIRELALFGANAIENIPNYGGSDSPVHVMSRHDMNVNISEICQQYGLEFWMWIPADFNLGNEELREEALAVNEETYRACPRVDAVFFPGGDPGSNPPDLVLPYITELAVILEQYHPDAKIWMSLQGFSPAWVDEFYAWLEDVDPRGWFGGVVHGPGSPDLAETRRRTPAHYPIRHYPDITHIVRCQYPHNQLDPVFAIALTRQGITVQPRHSQFIHNRFAPMTNGFLTYSDGAHDNVNKTVWSQLGWNPDADLREILVDYARFFFRPDLAEDIADALFGLEENWEGCAMNNGGITGTLHTWERFAREMEDKIKGDAANWRLQMMLFRATIDAYARYRLIYEQGLEAEACRAILEHIDDPASALEAAERILQQADTEGTHRHLRERIIEMAEDLWHAIGLQSDVETYQVQSRQRGAVLEYLDTPLNSRYWIEDEFERLREMDDEVAVKKRLYELATWQNPGEGSFYDDLGNIGNSPNVLFTGGPSGHPMQYRQPTPGYWAPDGNRARLRYGWLHTLNDPEGLRYEHLDPEATYLLRVAGYGDAKPRANGQPLEPTAYDRSEGGFKDFPVPTELYQDGQLTVTFDPLDERHLNWREWSRLAEVWLLKDQQPSATPTEPE